MVCVCCHKRRKGDKGEIMSKMAELEAGIREIVREELIAEGLKPNSEGYITQRRQAKIERENTAREGTKWSSFEAECLYDAFCQFCKDRSFKSGRSFRSITCKIRNMMHSGVITTW